MWISIEGYEELYSVSSNGKIRSDRYKRILKQATSSNGYSVVCLSYKGYAKNYYVHRLVAVAFLGNKRAGWEPNHKDGIKSNNKVTNLKWVTRSKNMEHAYKTGLHKPSGAAIQDHKGSKHGRSKLTEENVLEIRKLYKTKKFSHRDLAKMFNVSHPTIGTIINRYGWSHI